MNIFTQYTAQLYAVHLLLQKDINYVACAYIAQDYMVETMWSEGFICDFLVMLCAG